MKFYEITFSPTGGTKKAADILSRELSEKILKIDLCDRNINFAEIVLDEDDIVLIAVPSYGGRIPQTAVERLSALSGKQARAVLVCPVGAKKLGRAINSLGGVALGMLCANRKECELFL